MENGSKAFTIQPCRYQDLPAVLGLLGQLGEFSHINRQLKLDHIQTLFLEMNCKPEIYLNLVCTVKGEVAGFISMVFYKTLFHHGGTALINELVIGRVYRGQGLGKALVTEAINAAKSRGMDEIEVGTEQGNKTAKKFYHKAGFDKEYVLLGMEF